MNPPQLRDKSPRRARLRRTLAAVLAMAAASASGLLTAQAAHAAPVPSRYGVWTFAGSSTNYTGSVDLGAGFPDIAMTTDSRTPPGASAANPSGAISTSAVIRADSAFGTTYGSSQGQQYINLRPKADGNTQSTGSPSTTTYTFASPTPAGTWGIVLGDIDAETLTVTATDPAGSAVTGADLGATPFNYCGTPANATCAGGLATPNPTVDVTTTSVTAADPLCPPTDCNTSGAALSLQPTVPLSTFTVTSSWRQGFPSYQTWFATKLSAVNGRVTAPCALATPPTARLLDADGNVITSSPTDPDGKYSFTDVAAGNFRVDVDPATLPPNASAEPVDVDTSSGDSTAPDVAVRTSVTVAGTVQRSSTGPSAGLATVADLPVTLTPTSSSAGRRTTTDADGRYRFDHVADGQYRIAVEAAGHDVITPREQDVTVACATVDAPAFTAAATPSSTSPTTFTPTTSAAPSGSATSTASSPPDTVTSPTDGPRPGRDDRASQASLAATGSPLRLMALLALLATGAGLLIIGTLMAFRPVGGYHRSWRTLGHRARLSSRRN